MEKYILITGASSGFGLEMVKDFLKEGFTVIATMRNASKRLNLFSTEINLYKEKLNIIELDITSSDQIESLVQALERITNGRLDILVNNAGVGIYGALEDISEEQIRYQMEVNYFGPVNLIKSLLPIMRKSSTKIINISSLMGKFSCPMASVYSSSKYALEGISEGLSFELSTFGIQVCSIQPGGHNTNFTSSVIWGKNSMSEDSHYKKMSYGFKKTLESKTTNALIPGAKNVSSKVLALSRKKNMPRFVLAGPDAVSVSLLQVLLPRFLYQSVLNLAFKKLFK